MVNLIVIDDFYSNPISVRNFALRTEWLQKEALGKKFPGTESKKCFFTNDIVKRISKSIGKKISPSPERNSFGAFALTLGVDNQKKIVHIDGCKWTGIIYLTLDVDAKGGTNLYRHKKTGLSRLPNDSEREKLGYASLDEFKKQVLCSDESNQDEWELDSFVEMRFNRFVLFQGGQSFHAPDSYFGTNPENGRLVQLFFFDDEGDL